MPPQDHYSHRPQQPQSYEQQEGHHPHTQEHNIPHCPQQHDIQEELLQKEEEEEVKISINSGMDDGDASTSRSGPGKQAVDSGPASDQEAADRLFKRGGENDVEGFYDPLVADRDLLGDTGGENDDEDASDGIFKDPVDCTVSTSSKDDGEAGSLSSAQTPPPPSVSSVRREVI